MASLGADACGYTIEIRLRVNSQTDSIRGAKSLSSAASDSNADSLLRIGTSFVKWGNTILTDLQTGTSNSDGFHIFRLAMEGGQTAGSEKFTVWRDGVLLADNLTDVLPTYNNLNRLWFGDDNGGSIGGNVDIGYIRFVNGAYASVTTAVYALIHPLRCRQRTVFL